MYALYTALIVLFAVVVSPWLLYQAVRYRKYVASLPQRFGYLPVSFNIDAEPSIWIHAVSVGELLTARPLDRGAARSAIPGCGSSSRRRRCRRSSWPAAACPTPTRSSTFPFDLGLVVRRTLDLVKPRLFLMMETEIWPNLLRECRAGASGPRS